MRTHSGTHLRLAPLATLDMFYYLAYRKERTRVNGDVLVMILFGPLVAGLLLTLSSIIGTDIPEAIRGWYRIDVLDIPQSPLRRTAGPGVVVGLPAVIIMLLLFYRKRQIAKIADWYDNLPITPSFVPGFLLFFGSFAIISTSVLFVPKLFVFPFQLLFLVAISYGMELPGLLLKGSVNRSG